MSDRRRAATARFATCATVAALALAACAGDQVTGADGPPDESGGGPDTVLIALTDMGAGTYHGFPGGLYPGGNAIPAAHAEAGLAAARRIQPLDLAGDPAPGGRIVLISVGMSNTTQEFCSGRWPDCAPQSFVGQALADPAVDREALVLVDGASGGQSAGTWDSPAEPNYDRVDRILEAAGLAPAQVQVAWVKVANPRPTASLPAADADAYLLVRQMGDIVRALKTRYPNLRQVFLSSRTYGGYATTALNPEPFAYESGFAVKWLVEAQIRQLDGAPPDPRAGDLAIGEAAPWIAWGPYLWARGLEPRSDGLIWERADFAADGTHPAASGRRKVGTLLLDFFRSSEQASCWFLASRSCS